jgi:hypothetical protein
MEPTIKELFHGTRDAAAVGPICSSGFDCSLNRASAYGRGTYFATNARMSAAYMGSDEYELGYMFICDVLVGKCCVGTSGSHIDTKKYDNAVNSLSNPSIYVTPYHKGAFPKYVVSFYTEGRPRRR